MNYQNNCGFTVIPSRRSVPKAWGVVIKRKKKTRKRSLYVILAGAVA